MIALYDGVQAREWRFAGGAVAQGARLKPFNPNCLSGPNQTMGQRKSMKNRTSRNPDLETDPCGSRQRQFLPAGGST
jgi:hypothetical protein